MRGTVWAPDLRLQPARAAGAWEADTGSLRTALAGWRTGRPTVAVWGPHGARVTMILERMCWRMADGSRLEIAAPQPSEYTDVSPDGTVVRGMNCTDGIEEIWSVQGDRLKHSWRIGALAVPDGAVSLEAVHRLVLAGCAPDALTGRTLRVLPLWSPLQAAPVLWLGRGQVEDLVEGAQTHTAYEWETVREGNPGVVRLSTLVDAEWIRSAPGPIEIDPTILTTTFVPFAASNQRPTVTLSGDIRVDIVPNGTDLVVRYSTDGGQAWQTPTSGATVYSGGGDSSTYRGHSMFVLNDVIYVSLRSNSTTLVLARGTKSGTSFTWTTVTRTETITSLYPDVAAASRTDGKVEILLAYTRNNGSATSVVVVPVTDNAGTLTVGTAVTLANVSGTGGSDIAPPSIAIKPTDKTAVVAYAILNASPGYQVLYWRSASFTGLTWTTWAAAQGGTVRVYDSASSGYAVSTIPTSNGDVYCSFLGTATTARVARIIPSYTDLSYPADNVGSLAPPLSVDDQDRLYLWANIGGALQWRRYASGAWSGLTSALTATIQRIYAGRGGGTTLDVLLVTGSASPYSWESYRYTTNQAPQMPDALSPNGAGVDASQAWTLSATAHDDAGDYPTDAQWQVTDGTTTWYVTAAGALTNVATWVATGGGTFSISRGVAAGAFANGLTLQWRVKTRDQGGLESPWSGYATVTTTAAPVTTLVSPADGGTVTSGRVTANISVSGAFGTATYRLYADNAGAKGALLAEHIGITSTTRTIDYDPTNSTYYWVEALAVTPDGVAGDPDSNRILVSFTPPQAPAPLIITPDSAAATAALQATIPAAAPGEPVTTQVRFEASTDGGATLRPVATVDVDGSTVTATDYAARWGTTSYRAVAVGDNGTETASAWQETWLAFAYWRFIPADGANPLVFIQDTVRWRIEDDVQVPQTMDEYRQEFSGPTFARLADITATYNDRDGLTAREWRERCLALAQAGTAGYLKSPYGDVYLGTLRAPSGATQPASTWEQINLTFRQTGKAV